MTVESKKVPYQPSAKRKNYIFFEKILKLIWYLILFFIIAQVILITMKFFAKNPNERMCFDYSNCYEYCASFSGAKCLTPDKKDSDNQSEIFKLILMGKRNILEILNSEQGYCACEDTANGKNRIEVFYDYYSKNN